MANQNWDAAVALRWAEHLPAAHEQGLANQSLQRSSRNVAAVCALVPMADHACMHVNRLHVN
jgi:hypothetical protein